MRCPTVAFATLGCKVNTYDTEAVADLFRAGGYTVVDFAAPADVYIINTCSVTNEAARKSRQSIRRAVKRNPAALVVAMGCYAQYAPGEALNIPGVQLVVGTHRRAELVQLVEQARAAERPLNAVPRIADVKEYEEMATRHFAGRTRAIVKVQDGCNECCAFCQIPRVRGRSRSRRLANVLAQVQELVEQGYKEIVLTGIHLGAYGLDLPEGADLAVLVRQVAEVPGVVRLRLSSVDPHEFSSALVETMASHSNICRHLHIPAQSGEDVVLQAMRRRHTAAEFSELAARLRAALPGLAITSDIIVGFPGETAENFAATCRFCEEIGFSKIHVFPYSRRRGTVADRLPDQVAVAVRQERVERLLAIGDRLSLAYHQSLLGRRAEVLLEGEAAGEGYFQGLTENYVRADVPERPGLAPGLILPVRVTEASVHGIRACEEGRQACPANLCMACR